MVTVKNHTQAQEDAQRDYILASKSDSEDAWNALYTALYGPSQGTLAGD